MTNLFSKGFTLLFYHLREILPDSADSNRMLWSGLMYYPVFPVIQMPPPLVLGKNTRVWNGPLGILLKGSFIPRHTFRHVEFVITSKPVYKHSAIEDNSNVMQIRSPVLGGTIYQCSLILQAAICLSWIGLKMRSESCSSCFKHCW